jgi:hypothetical protein
VEQNIHHKQWRKDQVSHSENYRCCSRKKGRKCIAISTCGGGNEDMSKQFHYYRRCICIDGRAIKLDYEVKRLDRGSCPRCHQTATRQLTWNGGRMPWMTEVTVGLANISSRGRHIVQIMSVAAENEEALMIGWLIITRVCMNGLSIFQPRCD